jgi:hypothetical protein
MPSMLIAMVMMISVYLFPIIVGVCKAKDLSRWNDGYWPAVGGMIGGGSRHGDWLAGWITVTGTMMCAGTLSTLLLTSSQVGDPG